MNEEQAFRSTQALLVSSVWFCLHVGCLRCVGYACAYGVRRLPFFQQQKKGSKKCRSQTPRGWHSANRFCSRTTCVGLQGGLQDGCGLRDGLARCARWLFPMVFWDGIFAMASLNDCGTSREISCWLHIENQFSIISLSVQQISLGDQSVDSGKRWLAFMIVRPITWPCS